MNSDFILKDVKLDRYNHYNYSNYCNRVKMIPYVEFM